MQTIFNLLLLICLILTTEYSSSMQQQLPSEEQKSNLNRELESQLRGFAANPTSSMRNIANLLDKGAEVNARMGGGFTPLMFAVFIENAQELLELLMQYGADTSLTNDNGKTVFDLNALPKEQQEYKNILLQGVKNKVT